MAEFANRKDVHGAKTKQENLGRLRVPVIILLGAAGALALTHFGPELLQGLEHATAHLPHPSGGNTGGEGPTTILNPATRGEDYPTMLQPFDVHNFDGAGLFHFNGQWHESVTYPIWAAKMQELWHYTHPNAHDLTSDQLHRMFNGAHEVGADNNYLYSAGWVFRNTGNIEGTHDDYADQQGTAHAPGSFYDGSGGGDWYIDYSQGGKVDDAEAWVHSYLQYAKDDEQISVAHNNDTVGYVFGLTHGRSNAPQLAQEIHDTMVANSHASAAQANVPAEQIAEAEHLAGGSENLIFYFPLSAEDAALVGQQ